MAATISTTYTDRQSKVMAERIEQEFGIDRGTLAGIAQEGMSVEWLGNGGEGMLLLTFIGTITRQQYDRITAPVEQEPPAVDDDLPGLQCFSMKAHDPHEWVLYYGADSTPFPRHMCPGRAAE